MMISASGISEAGKSIAEPSERTWAASTGDSTALPSGLGEARRGLSRETNRLQDTLTQKIDRDGCERVGPRIAAIISLIENRSATPDPATRLLWCHPSRLGWLSGKLRRRPHSHCLSPNPSLTSALFPSASSPENASAIAKYSKTGRLDRKRTGQSFLRARSVNSHEAALTWMPSWSTSTANFCKSAKSRNARV